MTDEEKAFKRYKQRCLEYRRTHKINMYGTAISLIWTLSSFGFIEDPKSLMVSILLGLSTFVWFSMSLIFLPNPEDDHPYMRGL